MNRFQLFFKQLFAPKQPYQFKFTGEVREAILNWARAEKIDLIGIEYVVPFVSTDKNLVAYLFFDTDDRVKEYKSDGTVQKVKEEFVRVLQAMKYKKSYLAKVDFVIDSDENVQKNYEGNYFYRLR
jgi:hypothetical protein